MVLPAFSEYTAKRYRTEIQAALAEQLAGLARLGSDANPPTPENVLGAWEAAARPVTNWLNVFYSVLYSDATPELEDLAEELAPKLAAHEDAIMLDLALYRRLQTLAERIAAEEIPADDEDRYHLQELIAEFDRAGVSLNPADQERLREINERLAQLSSTFERLNREARNAAAVPVSADELAGLNTEDIEAVQADGWRIALVNSTQQPLAAKAENPELRQRLLTASLGRALNEPDTRPVIVECARLRAERASLLGFSSHAALVAARGTAKTTERIEEILIPLAQATLAKARAEGEELAQHYQKLAPGRPFTAADWGYVEAKLRKERFAFDENELGEYLTVDRVVSACYDAATELYGIQFTLRPDLEGHVSGAQVYEISDADGSPVGYFLMDLWARPTKNGGAWMTSINEVSRLSGELPVVTNNCNYRESVPTVTWDEVITMFHEFGHALHGLFGKAKYASRSGTNVPQDFVEFPSQVNEHWAWQPGRVLPAEWLDRLKAASSFGIGYANAEALIAAVLDYVWHSTPLDQLPSSPDDVLSFEQAALSRHGLADELVPPRYRSQYFAHIWGGAYAASYYGYSWAEVLDADAVAWFEENGGGTRANGDHFRATLLAPAGGIDPMTTYRRFRGRDATPAALLERIGIA